MTPEVHPVGRTLADRLEELRLARVASARDSVEFLKRLLELARQFVGAERAEAEGRLDTFSVLDPDRGALTQILAEYAPSGTPAIVEHVSSRSTPSSNRSAAPAGRRASRATARYAGSSGRSSTCTACRRRATSSTAHTPTSASTTERVPHDGPIVAFSLPAAPTGRVSPS